MMGARRTIFCLNAPAMVNKDYHVMMLVSTPQYIPATSDEAMAHDLCQHEEYIILPGVMVYLVFETRFKMNETSNYFITFLSLLALT
jgi:hypothetical protein